VPERLVTDVACSPTLGIRALDDTLASSAGLDALDRVISRHGPDELLAKQKSAASEALAVAIRQLCAEARSATNAGAERMVIALRAAWPRLPAVQRLPATSGRGELFESIVTLAIAEFYVMTKGSGEDADGAADVPGPATPS
jgi:hypothetical protein